MAAADSGSYDMADWLISRGADINATMPSSGWTAMHAAAKKGHRAIVELLLSNGADKTLMASHKEFGRNLLPKDVTMDQGVHEVLARRAA